MEILHSHVDEVEVVGLDEAYLDLSGYERPNAAARRVKAGVMQGTGLGCSIGMGPNKLVAKVASDADKPDGFLSLTAIEARERFGNRSPRLVPGIGPRTAQRLEQRGIVRLDQLAAVPEAELSAWFGDRIGPHLGRLARFEDDRKVQTGARVAKSESCETTFDHDLRGLDQLEPALDRLGRRLCERLGRQERSGRTIGIKVRFADFTTVTRARTIDEPVNAPDAVVGVARELLRALELRLPVRLLGVRVAGLDEERRAEPAAPVDQLRLSL
jgi:DNA polymerase-4